MTQNNDLVLFYTKQKIDFLLYLKAKKGEYLGYENLDEAKFVVKIEPKENGPLFCESHFYANCCKQVDRNKILILRSFDNIIKPSVIVSHEFKMNSQRFLRTQQIFSLPEHVGSVTRTRFFTGSMLVPLRTHEALVCMCLCSNS